MSTQGVVSQYVLYEGGNTHWSVTNFPFRKTPHVQRGSTLNASDNMSKSSYVRLVTGTSSGHDSGRAASGGEPRSCRAPLATSQSPYGCTFRGVKHGPYPSCHLSSSSPTKNTFVLPKIGLNPQGQRKREEKRKRKRKKERIYYRSNHQRDSKRRQELGNIVNTEDIRSRTRAL